MSRVEPRGVTGSPCGAAQHPPASGSGPFYRTASPACHECSCLCLPIPLVSCPCHPPCLSCLACPCLPNPHSLDQQPSASAPGAVHHWRELMDICWGCILLPGTSLSSALRRREAVSCGKWVRREGSTGRIQSALPHPKPGSSFPDICHDQPGWKIVFGSWGHATKYFTAAV